MELKYHKYTLPNGIRVFMVPKHETRAIYFEAMFKVGSRYENDELRGISHFLEHMAYKGTKKRPTAMDISKEVDQHGGFTNAYTGLDITAYWVKLPSEKLELAIDIISDILINSKLDEKVLNKEKGVILEEIKMHNDNPDFFAAIKFHELIFGDTPLGKDIAGAEEDVKSMNREKMLEYKNKFYKTNNMIIAIGGNFSVEKTKKLLKRYFGKIKGKIEDNYKENHIIQECPIAKIYTRKDTQQAKLLLGFRSFGRNGSEKDRYARGLLARALGYYMSSILFVEIREKRGLSYDIGCDVSSFDETGDFEIGGGFAVNKIPEVLKVVCSILKDIKKKGLEAKELKMAKSHQIGQINLNIENVSSWASGFATNELYGLPIETPDEIIKKTKKVTNTDIKRLAREIFRPENFNMVIVGPIDSKEEKKYLDLIKL